MPYVGNDVVDLKEPANAGKSRDSRFLKKILTNAEIEFVQNAGNSDAALWSHWACKETAYKVVKKSFSDVAFLPRQWPVTFRMTKSKYSDGEVTIPGKGKIYIRLFSNSQYVHCIGADVLTALDKLIWSVEALPEEEGINPSLFLRHSVGQNLAQYFSLNFHQIRIKRTRENGELQPPRVYVGNRKTDIDISLSHDGRFIAYVATLAESERREVCPCHLKVAG
ncbi:MAG: 4'-phosphopantetheinyl transferase superfamily protein [Deltaproteobacteria bacterium]|nr:4'-phosphopantetheinyl transferase superfamily protein [Deltaproteobacteria bacterium]